MIQLFTVVEVRKYHQLYSNHMDQHCRHEFLALQKATEYIDAFIRLNFQ